MCADLDFSPFFPTTSAVINALSQRYFLQANDQKDLKDWVEALNQASKITVRTIASPFCRGPRLFLARGLVGWGTISVATGAFPEVRSRPSSPTSSYTLADHKFQSLSLYQVQGEVYGASAVCFLEGLRVSCVLGNADSEGGGLENALLTARNRRKGKAYEEGSRNFVLT